MPKPKDPAWQYADPIPGNPHGTICRFCKTHFQGGGISRLKKHLAGGDPNVKICTQQGLEVRQAFRVIVDDGIDQRNLKKRKEVALENAMAGYYNVSSSDRTSEDPVSEAMRQSRESYDQEQDNRRTGASGSRSKTSSSLKKGFSKIFGKRSTHSHPLPDFDSVRRPDRLQRTMTQSTLRGGKDKVKDFYRVVAKWLHYGNINANAAVNNRYYQPMFEAAVRVGPGIKPPTAYQLLNPLLEELYNETKATVDGYKNKWKEFGCTVMCDGWTGPTRKTIMNFMVYCDGQTVFWSSVNISDRVKDHYLFMEKMKEVVDDIGKECVVQIVTDNGANYKKAGETLAQLPGYNMYWTGCAAHCVDLILKKASRDYAVASVITKAKDVTRYFYNHSLALAEMRKVCGGELVRAGMTRFATHFLALQSMLSKMQPLKALMTSERWEAIKGRRPTAEQIHVEELLLDPMFWAEIKGLVNIMEPLILLLRQVDGDKKPTMGFIHRWIDAALQKIKRIRGHSWLSQIIESKWQSQLGHKLHMAAYFLNPAIQYGKEQDTVSNNTELQDAVRKVISHLVPSIDDQSLCLSQLKYFKERRGEFGSPLCMRSDIAMMPADWWANFGGDTPQLRWIVVRILAQTVSSSGCERNWSTFGMIHSPKRCRMLDETLHRIVYVHYNLRLKENHYKITQEEREVDLSGLYPPDDDDSEDDAFEWVQRSNFPPELDEDRWPNAQVAEDMGERVHEHPPEPLLSPMHDSRGSRGDTVRDLPFRSMDVGTRVQAAVDLDDDDDATQSPSSSDGVVSVDGTESDDPDTPSGGGDSGGNVVIPTGYTEQQSMFRGVTNIDTQSHRQDRTSTYSQSQRHDTSRGASQGQHGRGSQRRGGRSQRRAGKEHATLGNVSSESDAASQWRIPGECAIGSRISYDGNYAYSQGDGSHSSYNQWGSQQGNDWTSEPMEIDSGNSWTTSMRSSLPDISTRMIEEYDGFPMAGFLLWGEQTQVSYNFYVESYLQNFYPQGIDWQYYCNVLMMPQAIEAPDGTSRGRNSTTW